MPNDSPEGASPWANLPTDGSTWFRENEHFFRPFSPLWASAFGPILHDTIMRATRELAGPVGTLEFRLFHGYAYFRATPFEGDRDEQRRQHAAAIERYGTDLLAIWRAEWLPRLQDHIEHMRAFDLHGASDETLLAHLDDALARQRDAWYIHFLVFWVMMSLSWRYDRVALKAGIADELLRAELVQDADNDALLGDRALAEVAQEARRHPAVAQTLREQPAAEALRALPQLPGGPQVLARLQAFLDRFGDRLAGGDDWAEPTWREAREQALQRAAALLETTSDGHVDHTQLIERRERLTAEVLCSIEDPDLRREFEESLRMMRRAWPLKEEHNFYIDQTLAAHMRYVMQEIGRRLKERGAFDAPDDVFMLTLDEALDAFRAPQAPVLRSRVAERKAEREWQLSLDPPMLLGSTMEPEGAQGPSAAPDVLRGRPGSPGRASGPARLVLSIDDFPKLRAGDILVCRSTTPHWTPLFQSAAGIVAEAGGALSHAAIAAREYGIPAVLSVPAVTAILADGELIEVDGAAGEVRRSID